MTRIFQLLLILGLTQTIFSQTKNFIDQPYLETTALVDTFVTPDEIYLRILLSENDERNRVNLKELETRMFVKLEDLGIDLNEQLELHDFASNFKRYIFKSKKIIKEKAFSLKIYDTETATKVLQGLEEINISNISLYKSEFSKLEQLKLELKTKAIKKAKLQAEYLTEPLNQKIKQAIHITDKYYEEDNLNFYLDEVVVTGYAGSKNKQEHVMPNIEFKPIQVESQVTVKFQIE